MVEVKCGIIVSEILAMYWINNKLSKDRGGEF